MAWGKGAATQKTLENGQQKIIKDNNQNNDIDNISSFDKAFTSEPLLEKKPFVESDPTCSSFASLPVPPDGGYGWIVCAGAFMSMVILDGMMFSFGVFFLDLLDAFNEGKGKTALVGSTLMGAHLIFGPITAVLVNMFDCRRVAIVGAILATIAFAGSTLSPNLDILIFLYGFCGGIGVSMIYIPSILIVGFYFEKKRAIANGIANSGSGVGTFIYAPLSRLLLDEYSWSGGLLILAGVVLNCAVFAALFRPVGMSHSSSDWKLPDPEFDDFEDKAVAEKVLSAQWTSSNTDFPKQHGTPVPLPKTRVGNILAETDKITRAKSQGDLPSVTLSVNALTRRHPRSSHLVFMSTASLKSPGSSRKLASLPKKKYYVSKELLNHPLARKDAFYSGSMNRLEQYKEPNVPFQVSMLRLPPALSEDDVSETVNGQTVMELLHSMLGLELLASPMFLMCVLMGVMWTAHSSVLYIFPDYTVLTGISRPRAALLVSIIGISNIVGRLVAGFVSDRPCVDPVWVNASALLLGSAVTYAIPFTKNYIGLGMEAGVFGLCMGAWTSLRPIILVELLGLDRLTNAFGLMAMFQGIAFTVGSPITGALFDYTKSYKIPFIVAGSAFLISGILSLMLRFVAKCENRHRQSDLDIEA